MVLLLIIDWLIPARPLLLHNSPCDYEGRGRPAAIRKICLPKPLLTLKGTPKQIVPAANHKMGEK
jgi:hypothetical protein